MVQSSKNETRLIRLPQVVSMTGLSKATIYRLIGNGEFPKNVSLGARSVAWVGSEVEQWIASRILQRDEVAA